jgi:hypothetical protein
VTHLHRFDPEYYLQANPDVAEKGVDPLAHYQAFGVREGRQPNDLLGTREAPELIRNAAMSFARTEFVRIIRESGLFDEAYYRRYNPDVTQNGLEPIEHYVRHGVAEGRKPNPWFETADYIDDFPDAAATNPLVHFIRRTRAQS